MACGVSFSQTNYAERDLAIAYASEFLSCDPTNVSSYVHSVSATANDEILGVLAATTAIITGEHEGKVFDILAQVNTNLNLFAVIENPEAVLDEETVFQLQELVIKLHGVAAAVIPPPDGVAMRLVPPIAPLYNDQ